MNRFPTVAFTGKKQRLLWLSVMAVSIMAPLMILKINITAIEFPTLRGAWENGVRLKLLWMNDSEKAIGFSDLVSENQETKSSLLLNQNFSQDYEVPFSWCQQPSNNNYSKPVIDSDIDCESIFSGDKSAIDRAKTWTPPCAYDDESMAKISCDCAQLTSLFHFEKLALTEEELNYPLAFIFVVEKNAEQVVRLLASIYQPQNIYCFTYDEHSTNEFKKSIQCLGSCFDNVLLPEKHAEIYWADISILEATTNCMRLLVNDQKSHDWKYVQILSWNDLALRTNSEMVRIFKILNGSSDSELTYGQPERFRKFHFKGGVDPSKQGILRPVAPAGVTVYKGSFAVSLPRSFCDYVVNNIVAKQLYSWSQPMWAPEEQFWSTLIHNTHLNHTASFPGTCLHYYKMENRVKEWISRYQIWNWGHCAGKMISGSCCFGVGDLFHVKKQAALVAHKFYATYQPAAWYCMLKWRHDRTYNISAAEANPLNIDYYQNLPAVRYHRSANKADFTC